MKKKVLNQDKIIRPQHSKIIYYSNQALILRMRLLKIQNLRVKRIIKTEVNLFIISLTKK